MSVGLVVVSHSARIAEGVLELAAQMAPSVRLIAAGGTPDGGIGTDFDRVLAALADADDGDGVVVLYDLGSAVLTAETALDLVDAPLRARTAIADAPIVEGSVAAAVAAEIGGDLDAVRRAAEGAGATGAGATDAATGPLRSATAPDSAPAAASVLPTRRVTLVNPSGLHARPASELVRAASGFDAVVRVNGADAASLLSILALGAARGTELELVAEGPDAGAALAAIVALVESGFGELDAAGD